MINLVPMTEEDFQAYLTRAVSEYAADKVRAGNWPEADAIELSRQNYARLLPQGIHTPANFVGKLLNEDGQTVGILWYARLGEEFEEAFIFDFEVYAPFRRRGYASQALAALEVHAKALGVKKLGLHVFGYNTPARELYKKTGFIETNVNMAKEI
jgi:ribosomal protein S18 acetylase RimI-like enzyme